MSGIISWLIAHEALAGWAQFLGAVFALIVTYLTAFAPTWRRKRQLKNAALRLLSHGYETVESYHRTSENFLPFPISIRVASMTMAEVAGEIGRFPIFELDDQGPRSIARQLVTVSLTLRTLSLFLEAIATELDDREGTADDQANIRTFVGERLDFLRAMLSGAELKRPEWKEWSGSNAAT